MAWRMESSDPLSPNDDDADDNEKRPNCGADADCFIALMLLLLLLFDLEEEVVVGMGAARDLEELPFETSRSRFEDIFFTGEVKEKKFEWTENN